MAKSKKHAFKAETQKVLSILTHSLYTNREIFLRELLFNASDALDKLRFLKSKGETVRDSDLPLEIRISANSDEGVLLVEDTGLGMTEKELVDHLGTIAKSGSEQFLKDMGEPEASETEDEKSNGNGKDKEEPEAAPSAAEIIGRFGYRILFRVHGG